MSTPIEKPPVIYLDTQDFSRFSDFLAGRIDQNLAGPFVTLLHLVETGKIIVPVTMGHLSELLQYDGGGRELTLRKANAIEKLSRGNALHYVSDVMEFELVGLSNKEIQTANFQPPFPLSHVGEWHPRIQSELRGFREKITSEVSAKMKEAKALAAKLPRQQRRAFQAKLDHFTRNISSFFEQGGHDALVEFSKKYPISDRMVRENLLSKFVAGGISDDDFIDEVFAPIRRPSSFVEWYFEKYDGEKMLPDWMHSFGNDLVPGITEMQARLACIPAHPPSKQRKAHFRDLGRKSSINFARKLIATEEIKAAYGNSWTAIDRLEDAEIERLPTINLLARIISAYAWEHSQPGPITRKPKLSDGGDIIHALYLPYVDLWRGDRGFATIVQQATVDTNLYSRIVPNLHELPAAIEKLI